MLNIAYRNLMVFVRDRANVFFSFLGVLVIIMLYLLFLGDMMIGSYTDRVEGVKFLMDSWIMAGVVAVTSITTTMGALGIMVEDRQRKLLKDFNAAPIKRYKVAGGYILSTVIIGFLASILSLIFAEVFIVVNGGEMLKIIPFLKMLGLIAITVLSSSAMMYFVVCLFKSQNAFSAASTLIGTLAGFITGIYMPIGEFAKPVQYVIKAFPTSHAASLMRQVMMEVALPQSFAKVPDAARPESISMFEENMGIVFKFGDYYVEPWLNIVILAASVVLFYFLAIVLVSRKSK